MSFTAISESCRWNGIFCPKSSVSNPGDPKADDRSFRVLEHFKPVPAFGHQPILLLLSAKAREGGGSETDAQEGHRHTGQHLRGSNKSSGV